MADHKKNPEEQGFDDEAMTVDMTLDDSTTVTCSIVTILTANGQDYIVLLPLDENGENHDGEVWIYRYYEDESDPNAEPRIEYIDDEEEYDMVSDKFDEYLDSVEFDELIEDDDEDLSNK